MELMPWPLLIVLGLLIATSMGILYLTSRVSDQPLPHNLVTAAGGSPRGLAIVLSGERGWIRFDQKLAEYLAAARLDVLGLDSLRYFYHKKKTPAKLAGDLSDAIRHWAQEQKGNFEIVFVGYAKGADVLPFAVNLLEPELRQRIKLVALLGVGRLASFRLQLSDLWGRGRSSLFPAQVTPEIRKLEDIPGLCVYGDKDRVSLCRNLKRVTKMEVKEIAGGPMFQDSAEIADLILGRYFESAADTTEPSAPARVEPSPVSTLEKTV